MIVIGKPILFGMVFAGVVYLASSYTRKKPLSAGSCVRAVIAGTTIVSAIHLAYLLTQDKAIEINDETIVVLGIGAIAALATGLKEALNLWRIKVAGKSKFEDSE